MNTACPPKDSLRRYAIGEIEEIIADEIEQHLVECPSCEDTVAQFDSADDTLMRHLALAGAVSSEGGGSSPGWLDRLRGGPPVGRVFSPPNSDVNVVEPSEETPNNGQFSAYDLLGVLGRGGMGVVYRARHRQLNRHVALKVLSPRLTTAAEARRRFEREIQVLGGLHHPGIVMATDAGRVDGAAYLVMELIDGVDLTRLVRQGGPLSVAEACEAARQMADALAAAHQAETVHRDVKPSNVMVDRRGRVKLLDFGLAHLSVLSTESLETSLGRLLGTLDYMAPEQAGDQDRLDSRADLYSLGATLFFLLTGQPPHGPHTGRSLVNQLRALAAGEAQRVRSLRADVPAELDEFIAKLLSREPDERPVSAEAVAAELARWAGGDLAARVAETMKDTPSDEAANNGEAAQQSLYELLGVKYIADPSWVSGGATGGEATEKPTKMVGPFGGGRITRSVMSTLAAAAAFGAIAFGIVIVLNTRNGTLRIESEVDDVQVTLIDEQETSRELEVTRGVNSTLLRAGQYQVRLSGPHDGITIDPSDVITLKRGQETVAKITREPVAATTPAVATRGGSRGEASSTGRGGSEIGFGLGRDGSGGRGRGGGFGGRGMVGRGRGRGTGSVTTTAPPTSAGREFAMKSDWEAASRALATEVEADPEGHLPLIFAATVELHLGRDEVYRRYCETMLQRFSGTSYRQAAERIARVCSLAPGAVRDFTAVERLIDRAIEAEPEGQYWPMWNALAKGLVEYRAGRAASAEKWLNQCLTYTGGIEGEANRVARDGIVAAIMAMAQFDQGKTDDAKASLEKARTLMKAQFPEFPDKPYVGQLQNWIWYDALHCLFLIQEAEQKLGGGPASTDSASRPSAGAQDRLYKGKPESEWQRLFLAETEPLAKLESATALIQLAALKPEEQQISQILDVGEEVIRAAYGDAAFVFAVEQGISTPNWPYQRLPGQAGGASTNHPGSHTNRLLVEIVRQLSGLSHPLVAAELSKAATQGSAPRSAFALRLLGDRGMSAIETNPAAVATVLRELDIPGAGVNRWGLCLLVRARYAHHLQDPNGSWWQVSTEVFAMLSELDSLARGLRSPPPAAVAAQSDSGRRGRRTSRSPFRRGAAIAEAPSTEFPIARRDELRNQMKDELFRIASSEEFRPLWRGSIGSFERTLAQLVLEDIIERRPNAMERFPFSLTSAGVPPYDYQYYKELQHKLPFSSYAWVDFVNSHLRAHSNPPFDPATRDLVHSLDLVFRLYPLPMGDQDTERFTQTAAILTEQLRRYYTDDPNATTDQSVEDLLPASPAMLLTQIVRIMGEIPDFVRNGHPRPRAVQERLKRFVAAVNGFDGGQRPNHNEFAGLYDAAPLEVIRQAIEVKTANDRQLQPSVQLTRHWLILATTGATVTTTASGAVVQGNPDSFADPLVLLAALGDLAGGSDMEELQIAQLLRETETVFRGGGGFGGGGRGGQGNPPPAKDPREVGLKIHLQHLLKVPLKAREHAKRMLRGMAAKAKSQVLIDAIKEIDPTIDAGVVNVATQPSTSQPASADAARGSTSQPPAEAAEQRAQLWPKFVAETDAEKKLDMALQLLNLATGTPENRLKLMLDVGAEIVRVSYGTRIIDFVLGSYEPQTRPSSSWVIRDNIAVREKSRKFNDLITAQLRGLPIVTTANVLTTAALERTDFHAAMALRMLSLSISPLHNSPEASQIVLTKLDVPMSSPDWSVVLLLQRLMVARHANAEQLAALFAGLNDLAKQLQNLPPNELTEIMKSRLYLSSSFLEPNTAIPVDLQQTLARLNLDLLAPQSERPRPSVGGRRTLGLSTPNWRLAVFFGDYSGYSDGNSYRYYGRRSPYAPNSVANLRSSTRSILHVWHAVANAFLEQRRTPPFDDGTRRVMWALGNSLELYSDGDEWPVEQSTQLLTDYLRQYFVADDVEQTEQRPEELLPVTPERLLSHLVGITGEIPDFVRTGRPKTKLVNEDAERFARLVTGQSTGEDRTATLRGERKLLDDDPYRAVEIALREAVPSRSVRGRGGLTTRNSFGQGLRPVVPTPAYLLDSLAGLSRNRERRQPQSNEGFRDQRGSSSTPPLQFYDPDIDSLLLLAILNDLAGTDAARDGRIATLLAKDETAEAIAGMSLVRKDLRDILAGQLKSREHAKRMLREMAAKAKSQALIDAIKEMDPTSVPAGTAAPATAAGSSPTPVDGKSANADKNAAAERYYKGHTEAEWQRMFVGETDSITKIDSATSLLVMAEDGPADKKVDRMLLVGEELVRSQMGDNALSYPLIDRFNNVFGQEIEQDERFGSRSSTRSRGTSGGGRGRRGVQSSGRSRRSSGSQDEHVTAYRRFHAQLQGIAAAVPAGLLATQLSKQAVSAGDPRAAFALGLLSDRSRQNLGDNPDAAKIVLKELSTPLTPEERSMVIHLTRAKFVSKASEEVRREVAKSLQVMAGTLADNRNPPLANAMIDSLLDSARILSDWPDELRQGFGPAVMSAIVRRGDEAINRYFGLSGDEQRRALSRELVDNPWIAPYDQRYVAASRSRSQYFLQEWLPIVNAGVKEVKTPFDDATRNQVLSLDKVLALYSDGDSWPVEQTAEILTSKLREYYTTKEGETTDDTPEVLLPGAPALLLTQIVRITGSIPDFVLTGRPRSKDVQSRLGSLSRYLSSDRQGPPMNEDGIKGLFELAPLEVVKFALSNTRAQAEWQLPYTPRTILFDVSNDRDLWNPQSLYQPPPLESNVDPILLLALLTHFSGENETQDGKIATLIGEDKFSIPSIRAVRPDQNEAFKAIGLRRHLQNLLASPLQAREHARRMLREMTAKAKSQALIDAIKDIDPTMEARAIDGAGNQ